MKSEVKAKPILEIRPHPGNPDNNCFAFANGANGLRVKRVMKSDWVNFIAQNPIT